MSLDSLTLAHYLSLLDSIPQASQSIAASSGQLSGRMSQRVHDIEYAESERRAMVTDEAMRVFPTFEE